MLIRNLTDCSLVIPLNPYQVIEVAPGASVKVDDRLSSNLMLQRMVREGMLRLLPDPPGPSRFDREPIL